MDEPCPEVRCARHCEHGFVEGRDGCPTCDCVEKEEEQRCPRGCTSFFDGCNRCSCGPDGEITACTRKFCERPKEPQCTDDKDNEGKEDECAHYVIDVRSSESFLEGHADCAANFPRPQLDENALMSIRK